MKKLLILGVLGMIFYACGNSGESKETAGSSSESSGGSNENPSYDTAKGVGKFSNVEISATLDATKAAAGQKVYEVKCSSCHKLTDERLVGPGWAGVTHRNKPEWIMNFVTNPDEMLAKDPKAQSQLEICLVRMPNQNLSDDDARNVYEFMRQNDGVK